MRIVSLSLVLLIAAPGLAEETRTTAESVEALRTEAENDSQVMTHLKELCELGPRLTGSTGIRDAYRYAQKRFESYGLKVSLEEWGSYPVGFDRGQSVGKLIGEDGKATPLTFGTNAWTAGTDGAVRGLAVLAPKTPEAFAKVKDRLKGAWVLGARSRSGRRSKGLEAKLWEAGIAGWVSPVRGELIVTSGRPPRKMTMETLPTQVRVKLVRSAWKTIVSRVEAGEELKIEFDIQNRFKAGPFKHYNVVADLVGSEKPDALVIARAHTDPWDEDTATTDNGTGISTTLEAARLLSATGAKPKRTIRFVLWSGEEQGLLGSRAYVKQHASEMKGISAVLVHDGGTNTCSGISVTPAMKPQIEEAFAAIQGDADWPFTIKEVKGLSGGGSDHNSYLAAGVPGFFWHQKGKAVYTHTHHTQHDKFDQAISAYQQRSALVIAAGALGIANLGGLLDRTKLLAPRRARGKTLGVMTDGLSITQVVDGSRAKKAGVREGDTILSMNGVALKDLGSLRAAIKTAWGPTPFVVLRDGKRITLSAAFPKKAKAKPGAKTGWF